MTSLSESPTPKFIGGRPRATMKDVARLAGVSLKTVSRVVNRESGVSDALVARVQGAADRLDYRLDSTASNLRRLDRRTATIGLLVEDVANEFSSAVHGGVEDVARTRNVAVLTASIEDDPEREQSVLEAFLSRRVDGLIVVPTGRAPLPNPPSRASAVRPRRPGWSRSSPNPARPARHGSEERVHLV